MDAISHLLASGQSVLLIWGQGDQLDVLTSLVSEIRQIVGSDGSVALENIDRLLQCKLKPLYTVRNPSIILIVNV